MSVAAKGRPGRRRTDRWPARSTRWRSISASSRTRWPTRTALTPWRRNTPPTRTRKAWSRRLPGRRCPRPAPPTTRTPTLHPRTYNEARTIGEHFREGTPVIMNLSEMVDSDAKRLVDFAAGLIFGLRGSIDRVTNRVFLLSPASIEVTAEDKARIAERGFFNQS